MQDKLLVVKNLTLSTLAGKVLLREVSFSLNRGETLAIVGESGAGKSLLAAALMGLLPMGIVRTAGDLYFNGQLIDWQDAIAWQARRGREIAWVLQEPHTSLNPVLTIGQQVAEALARVHSKVNTKNVGEWLAQVGLPDHAAFQRYYPFQLSGGMRQRVLLAQALATSPALLIADEPTTALDVTLQAQLLRLLAVQQRAKNLSLLLITHDLAVARQLAHQVLVLRHGQMVEMASAARLWLAPQQPYTQQLLAASRPPSEVLPTVLSPDICRIDELGVSFPLPRQGWRKASWWAVEKVSLQIPQGQTLALIGESGCGKSTVAKALLGLQAFQRGRLWWQATPFPSQVDTLWRQRIQMVFQDPYSSLNPQLTIAQTLREGIRALRPDAPSDETALAQWLVQVGLSADMLGRYPHHFSGGQRQRIAIARALAVNPQLLILDEPTSALDVSVQVQILQLLFALQQKMGLSYLLITHDFNVVRRLAHQVAVMYHGRIVESGQVQTVLTHPQHPYTQMLLAAVPSVSQCIINQDDNLSTALPSAPVAQESILGCAFAARCSQAHAVCYSEIPTLVTSHATQRVACHAFNKAQ